MSQLLKSYSETDLTLIGFVIFFVLFLFFVASTFMSSQQKKYDHLQNLPFEGDETGKNHLSDNTTNNKSETGLRPVTH